MSEITKEPEKSNVITVVFGPDQIRALATKIVETKADLQVVFNGHPDVLTGPRPADVNPEDAQD